MALNPLEKAKLYRIFYPVVPIIVTAEHKGEIGGLTAISYISLSFDPPLVGVSISPENRTHFLTRESGYFAMNWLDVKHADKILFMGEKSSRVVKDKIEAAGLSVQRGKSPAPVLKEAAAILECRVESIKRTGDHDLFVGECVYAYALDDFHEYWRFEKYSPPLYMGTGHAKRIVTLSQ